MASPSAQPASASGSRRFSELSSRWSPSSGSRRALVKAVEDVRDGRSDLSLADTFDQAHQHLAAVLVAGILAALGIILGLILLIVPGLVLLTWWAVIIPVVVLENRSAGESFTRSRELVRGYGWNVFGVIVVVILLLIGVDIQDHPQPAPGMAAELPVAVHLGHADRAVHRDGTYAALVPPARSQGDAYYAAASYNSWVSVNLRDEEARE